MIAAHAIISGFIDEPMAMHMHMCMCEGGVCIPNELLVSWLSGGIWSSGASRVSLCLSCLRATHVTMRLPAHPPR